VRRRALAGVLALACVAAGLLAAGVTAGVRPLVALATTGSTSTTTTAPTTTTTAPPVIAPGVKIANVAVGGMSADDAYAAVTGELSQPLVLVVAKHRLGPLPSQLGASARVGDAVARAQAAAPGAHVALDVQVRRAKVRAYVALLAKRFDSRPTEPQLFLRNLRPSITKPRAGSTLYRGRAESAIVSALLANRHGPVRLRQKAIPPAVTRAGFGPVIVIRRGSNHLYLYRGMQLWRTFAVATGQSSYPTPLGRFRIVVKWRNPWWYPPASPWAKGLKPVPPGPGNPLGTRWMGLSAPGVGIHGTPDAASIGYSASHGCIRMRIPEAEWLFRHVEIGTTVFIVPA
jgi:lipoprotein-anchoring transpeptidase ErfK/SrfK